MRGKYKMNDKKVSFVPVRNGKISACDFKSLMLLYAPEIDGHQNRKTPPEVLSKWVDSIVKMSDDTNSFLELCYFGETAVGFCYGKIDRPHRKGCIRPDWGYVMEFYVLPEYRRKGLGKRMYLRLQDFFNSKDTAGIYLTSDPVTGKPFWGAMGFIATGEISANNNQEIFEKR